MEFITIIIFIAIIINFPFTIANYIGLQFQVSNPECPQDIKDVKNNIRTVKIIQTINLIIFITIFIVSLI